jgi:osmotically-inducible protein OsmY
MKKFWTMAFAAVLGFGILGGCSQEAKEDLDKAGDNMAKAGDQIGDAAAADTANAGATMGNAAMTGKIKTALMSAEGVDSEHINVDTIGNTVTLKGSVDTDAAKAKAEQIAKDQAGADYTIDNQLTVGPASTVDPAKNN